MATTGPFNATKFRMEIKSEASGGAFELLCREKEVKITFASEKLDVTSKCSQGWGEFIGGMKSWSGSGSGLVDFTPAVGETNIQRLLDEFLLGDRLVDVRFSTKITGDLTITGKVFIENIEITATHEAACEMSFSFSGVGAPVVAPYA